jgi:predicted deacylase
MGNERFSGLYFVAVATAFLTAASTFAAPHGPYSEVQGYVHHLAEQYPQNAQVFELGKNNAGDTIEGLRVGSGPVHNIVVATHHGNEYGSTEVAKAFAAAIAEKPIDGQTVYVIPVLNIPGYNSNNRYERIASGSVDPNRDYPGPCGTQGPFLLNSTHALADFIDHENIVASATLHTFQPAVVYPWGISTQDTSTPYDSLFQHLTAVATEVSKYATGNSTEVVYPADGAYEDYAFWKLGVWSLLFEMGETHSPDADQVAEMNRVNVPGLRRFFEEAPHTRADKHDFTGRCDTRLRKLDLGIE